MDGDDHGRVFALFSEGRDNLREGRPDAAIALLEPARDLEPRKSSIRETLALAYLRVGRLIDAEAELAVAIGLAANDPYCYYLRGRAEEGLGFTAHARGSYKLAAWLDPASAVYRRALDRIGAEE